MHKDGVTNTKAEDGHVTQTIGEDIKESWKIRLKISASQVLAALATNIVKFTFGTSLGFTIVLITELYKEDAEIHATLSEITWLSSSCFMAPFGSLFVGLLAQNIGTKLAMLTSSIFYSISLLLFYYATTSTMLLCAQAITGFIGPIASGPGVTYVAEITQPHLRSTLIATSNFSIVIGSFLTVLLGNLLYWKTIALVNLFFPVLGFIVILMIPESPHWLAHKGQFERANMSLAWLRGWTTSENVALEFNTLKESHQNMLELQGKSSNSCCKISLKSYLTRSFCLPLAIVCVMFTIHASTGYNPLHTYSMVIFDMMESPIEKHAAAAAFDAARILGAAVCILSVHYTGKKRLMYISLISAGLAYFIIGVSLLFAEEDRSLWNICPWITTVLMIISTFLTSAGIDKVVYMMNAEVFPTKYRNVGAGIGLFVLSVCAAVTNKLFLYVLEIVTLPGMFFIFGSMSIFGVIVFHFIFPETENRTLKEIEDHYNGNKKISKTIIDRSQIES